MYSWSIGHILKHEFYPLTLTVKSRVLTPLIQIAYEWGFRYLGTVKGNGRAELLSTEITGRPPASMLF